jgi:nucleoside-diphosphate-sugar epimerase
VRQFYGSLRDGSAPPVRLEDGVLTARLMDQIRRALDFTKKTHIEIGGPSRPARALVTGATGFLGGRLIERLAEEGVAARATTRLVSRARAVGGVEWVRCNLDSDEDLRRAMAGVETVFHCAAMAGAPGSLEEYEEANVAGTLRVARIAEEMGVRTLVYVSSISVYAIPPRGKSNVDEASAYDARADERGSYTRSKLAADRALIERARGRPRPRIVLLRPGTLFGPGASVPIGRFPLPLAVFGRSPVAGSRRVPMPLSFVDNVIDAMLAAERADVTGGSIFNIVDDPNCDQGVVARTLAEVSHGRIRTVFVPYRFIWLLMLAADVLAWVRGGRLGSARYRLKRTLADMRYPCLAAREQLQWAPRVSLPEGLGRVLAVVNQRPYPW